MESDPTLMCELLVGLGEVDVVGISDDGRGPLWVTVRSRSSRPVCQGCAGPVWSKGDRPVRLVDLPVFGRPVRLWWRKRRWMCPDRTCEGGSFVEQDSSVAPERGLLTSRAGRWATVQVGRLGRTVSEVAVELGCDWHTVNNEVVRWGEALLETDTGRYGSVEAVGVDETLFWREGRWRTKRWCTSVVDVKGRQLLDIVPGRTAKSAAGWFRAQPADWRAGIRWAVLDMSGSYQVAYDQILPHARQVADPFHVVRLANQRLDEVRRRVQNETLGHRGRKGDPLYRIRRLLTKAHERLDTHVASKACLGQETPTEKSATPGTPRKPCGHIPNRLPSTGRPVHPATNPRPTRPLTAPRDPTARSHHLQMGHPDNQLAPLGRHQRTHRSHEQPDQTHQTNRLRIPQLRQLPN